ncbi:MAG: hypothetical protein ACRENP_23350 [Longimicrobiales bacterium]
MANNRRKAFEVTIAGRVLPFPYSRLETPPSAENPVQRVFVDPELGGEGFTYELQGGEEDSLHVDAVLDYNRDPAYLQDLLLYDLTLEAQRAAEASDLSKREIIRRMRTSASQFYRLLDPANQRKSIGQMLALLSVLDCEVQMTVRNRGAARSARVKHMRAS